MRHLPIVLLVACGSPAPVEPVVETPPPAPVSIEAPAKARPAAPTEQRFVRASSLNLRSDADAASKSLGKLVINSPLVPLQSKGDWVRVKVANGKEGWVGAEFLADEVLTVDMAMESARTRPTEALAWWQRAAAIDPNREVLKGLLAEYQKAGRPRAATAVETQLTWPHQMHLVWEERDDLPANTVKVSWGSAGYDASEVTEPRKKWSRHGLDPEAVWHILPTYGPVVKAKAVKMTVEMMSECDGEFGRNVILEHEPLPRGADPLVATRATPPKSWVEIPAPSLPEDEASKAVLAAMAAKKLSKPTVHIVPNGAGWRGYVQDPTGAWGELGNPLVHRWPVEWSASGVKVGDKESDVAMADELGGFRDVLGNGHLLQFDKDWCGTTVFDLDNDQMTVKATPYRCCGC